MRRMRRCLKILSVFFRYRLKEFLPRDKVRWPLQCFFSLSVFFPKKSGSRGERLRLALQELGPVFIKFGQLLSTRRDLLPDDIADELAYLQDRVEPFDENAAIDIIESSLGKKIDEVFVDFSTTALASASVAQVHAASLIDSVSGDKKDVVVKVIRPGIKKIITEDLQLLLLLARLVESYADDGYRLKPVQIVKDYEHIIFDELDLQREGANCAQLKRNFTASEQLLVPEVYFDFTNKNVLVLERVYGPTISDIESLKKANCNLKTLAETGVEIFFTQVFKDNFFHADMHPGNIFVDTSDPEQPKYIALDCAIMGSLTEFDRYYIGRNLLAVFNRDYQLVAKLHVDSGWVPEDTNVFEFETVIRSACEPIFEKPLEEISFGTLLIYLFQAAQRFGMEVQPSLVLLQKTLLNIEGLGRQLYPQLDLWATAHPFLDQWLKDRYSPKRMIKSLRKQAPDLLETLPELPELILSTLRKQSRASSHEQQLQRQLAKLEKANRRQQRLTIILITAVIATAFTLL